MLLAEVVEASARVAATPARSAKIATLADLLRRLHPDEVEPAIGFLVGEPRQGRIGVGWATFANRLAEQPERGAVPGNEIVDGLTIGELDRGLGELAGTTGAGSVAERGRLIDSLLARASPEEIDFIRDLLTGGLRQGALEGVMAEAVAKAAAVPAAVVRRACMLAGDLGHAAAVALTDGRAGLEAVGLEVLRPVQPMLASTAADVTAAVTDLGLASVEWKLDGIRLQVHKRGDDVRIFTRNLNDITDRMPEVVAVIRGLPAEQVVLDGEALTMTEELRPQPFQDVMSRVGRRRGSGDTPHRGASPRPPSAPTSSTSSTSTARTSSTVPCWSGSPPSSGWPGRGASPAR